MPDRQRMFRQKPALAPLITVVTVVRNGEQHIADTIESVLAQSYTGFEYLVLDGASTDRTTEIIERYADRLAYWCSEPDSGLYNAMNKALCVAHGEWMYFLNCGDHFCESQVLTRMAKRLQTTVDHDLVIGEVNLVRGEQVLDRMPHLVNEVSARKLFWSHFCHQAMFTRRTTMLTENGFDVSYRYFADFELAWRLIKRSGFLRVPEIIANFDADGITGTAARAVAMYRESECLFAAHGESRSSARYLAFLAKAHVYRFRKSLMEAAGLCH